MTTLELTDYIKSQLNKNISKYLIISRLIEVGWHIEDIEEGFLQVESQEVPKVTEINNTVTTPSVEKVEIQVEETVTLPVEPVLPVEPIQQVEPVIQEIIVPKIETVKQIEIPETEIAIQPVELEKPVELEIVETVTFPVEPIQTIVPVKPKIEEIVVPKVEFVKTIEQEEQNLETVLAPIEISEPTETQKIWTPITIEPKKEVAKQEPEIDIPVIVIPKKESPAVELIPKINKVDKFNTEDLKLQQDSEAILDPYTKKPPVSNNSMLDIKPKEAMISSYPQDILASTYKEEVPKPVVRKKSLVKLFIIVLVCVLVGSMAFAFVNGNIRFPGFKSSLSIVKKDPRNIILNTPNNLSRLKSYKVDNEISISSPSFSNITTGLASGEAVNSKDKESISISSKGEVNHLNDKLIFDNNVTIKSSILDKDITSDWKYDGSSLYISVPELSSIIGDNAPTPTTVALTPNQIGLMLSQFSPDISDMIKKVDIYNIMSEGIPLYVKTEAISSIEGFIRSTEYIEKGEEVIHGINTHHYELIVDRIATKKFLNSLVELLIMKLPMDQKQNLDQAIGASAINSFEVWVGEDDDNLYQIKFTLKMPLSRVLRLNDSGIGDNEVKLDWKTTYFDLDVDNKIDMPNDAIDMETFTNRTKDINIKNIIDSFRSQATAFKNSVGSYGLRSNPAGSCTNPNPGSLFSPKGHKKNADNAIASISSSMNSLLNDTNGLGSCYSTGLAWAIAMPLFDNPDQSIQNYYCTDSNTKTITLTTPITGPVCK